MSAWFHINVRLGSENCKIIRRLGNEHKFEKDAFVLRAWRRFISNADLAIFDLKVKKIGTLRIGAIIATR